MKESAFGFERPEDSPGFLLWQTTISWQRLIKQALAPSGMTHTDFVILAATLWMTEHQTEVNQSQISSMTKIDKMTISNSLKKLIKEGLISRSESKIDPRSNQIKLTAKGKKLISKLVPIVEKIDERFFGILHSEEEKSLIKILRKLSDQFV